MQIRKVEDHVYDVFPGVGFDTWVRVRKFHWGVKPLRGNIKLDRESITKVMDAIAKNPQGLPVEIE